MKKYLGVILFSLTSFPLCTWAVLPVIDAGAIANLVKEYHQLKQQYDLLHQTYQNAQQQLDKAKQIARDAEGHYGFGQLLNSVQDLKNRQWSPDNWQDALKGLAGGNAARYQQLLQQYRANHKTLSAEDFRKGASQANTQLYEQQIATNRAASVNSAYAFDDIKQHLATIHQLSQKIDQAPNTKAAIDLNTRMQTEIAYVQVQMLKQVAILNQQIARQQADTIAQESQSARFNRLPDQP